jgi:hypothetical protein
VKGALHVGGAHGSTLLVRVEDVVLHGAERTLAEHGRPLTGRSTVDMQIAVQLFSATRPPILRPKGTDYSQIERRQLIRWVLHHGSERRSKAFLVR